ncbi:unannotated protein [freshwater metagenome]|uniref:Unannotated protein n=1 Tax=freshwater metagenome TaxID=449393 RepID=A0A6J6MVV1_9ZZZZ
MNINPPNKALTAKKTMSRIKPIGPPRRGLVFSVGSAVTGIVVSGEPSTVLGTVVVT